MVTAECEIVINVAASVNFDDPLLDALQINFFGCLRMLELAKEWVATHALLRDWSLCGREGLGVFHPTNWPECSPHKRL